MLALPVSLLGHFLLQHVQNSTSVGDCMRTVNTVTMSDSLSLGLSFPFHLLLLKSPLSVIMDYGHLGGCPLQSPMPGSKVQIVIKTINTLVGRSQVYNARYR